MYSDKNNVKKLNIMTFTNEYPKREVIIETLKKVGDLTHGSKSIVHYRDFKGIFR